MKRKYLIIHADDFGFSPGISSGILDVVKTGMVSSTSVIVNSKYLNITSEYIKHYPDFDWGLHVLLNNRNVGVKVILDETQQQLKLFRESFGFFPSHLDYHCGFKFNIKTYFAVRMLTEKYHLSFRYDNLHIVETSFYGFKKNHNTTKDISVGNLVNILESLKEGVTELVCHPGRTSNRLKDPYRLQRVIEIKTLTSNSVQEYIRKNQIAIINFKDYKRHVR